MRRARRRRRVALTSLIDVIFLLLLFFMLTSTFSRYSEVELVAAGAAGRNAPEGTPLFLRLSPEALQLNTRAVPLAALAPLLREHLGERGEVTVIVSLNGPVTAQRLTDLLVALRGAPGVRPVILGAS